MSDRDPADERIIELLTKEEMWLLTRTLKLLARFEIFYCDFAGDDDFEAYCFDKLREFVRSSKRSLTYREAQIVAHFWAHKQMMLRDLEEQFEEERKLGVVRLSRTRTFTEEVAFIRDAIYRIADLQGVPLKSDVEPPRRPRNPNKKKK